MRTHPAVIASAILFGLASLAPAAELVSPPLPTGVQLKTVKPSGACRIRNTGAAPVNVQVSLFGFGNPPAVFFDDCKNVPLLGGHTCQVIANLPEFSYAACSVTAADVGKLRGTLQIRGIAPDPKQGFEGGLVRELVAEDLR